ncbi:MAG: aspartate-semialdehyde dehydrogenase [Clostridia bacterium]|nr:aspartate-semialdehyde dehydrogenase [Clostridia bacterium]
MMNKLRVGVVGCTGMVGQRFITLLEGHPYFDVTAIAASSRSAGKTYEEAVAGRWAMKTPVPEMVKNMVIKDASDIPAMKECVDFILCAVDMKKEEIMALEEAYAKAEIPVVSNNSAHRKTPDVPMVIPEINNSHIEIIKDQKKRLGTTKGFIAVKPNCSIQSYVPLLTPLMEFGPKKVVVSTYQAISGAGKTFESWPEMIDNVIPYIGGEEEKSEKEPLKVWGHIEDGVIKDNTDIQITSQCIRVPVTDGHLATTFVTFEKKPTKEQILEAWKNYKGRPQELGLHSAPKQFITYFEEDNRPQTHTDRDVEKGMGITAGRLREDSMFDYKFVGLSHNTLRGAAGGSLLLAELLYKEGYLY